MPESIERNKSIQENTNQEDHRKTNPKTMIGKRETQRKAEVVQQVSFHQNHQNNRTGKGNHMNDERF